MNNKYTKIPQWLIYTFLTLALIGFLDSSYLTIQHFRSASVGCFLFTGCDTVTSSKYSLVGSIPLATFGMAYYLFLIAGTLISFFLQKPQIFRLVATCTVFGFFISLYLVYLQAFVIGAFCIWCMISALTSALLFITFLFLHQIPPSF